MKEEKKSGKKAKLSTKDAMLFLFEQNKGEWFSGEEIASRLDVSRTAIWKAVDSLRAEGYPIDSLKSRGYRLSPDTDIVSSQGVEKYLATDLPLNTTVFDEVVSTNTLLKERASEGAKEGTVIIANSQTGGKGRLGRSFFSPLDTGLYISVLLRPTDMEPQRALRITTMAAVAACDAIEAVLTGSEKPQIKWVNDIFLHERKVVGILTEASMSMENGNLEYAVLGIGFNVYPPEGGFPEEIRNIAGAILPERLPDAKNKIAAVFLNRFFELYRSREEDSYSAEYKKRSLVLGKKVDVIPTGSGDRRIAKVLDITEECNLLVKFQDGKKETAILSSGEVSIRPK